MPNAPLVVTCGIIPACAGSTRRAPPSSSSPRDHPRMCGEHMTKDQSKSGGDQGSSSHVRGARRGVLLDALAHGIIPACAGSTRGKPRPRLGWRDHPRMCGEHRRPLPGRLVVAGSSPHVRGAPSVRWCATSSEGDHPRMCGEHQPHQLLAALPAGIIPACAGSTLKDHDHGAVYEGSSPHVRGAPKELGFRLCIIGIIPA